MMTKLRVLNLALYIAGGILLNIGWAQPNFEKEIFIVPYGEKQGCIPFEARLINRSEEQEAIPVAPTVRISPNGQRILLMYQGAKEYASEAVIQVFDRRGKWLRAIYTKSPPESELIAGRERFYIFYEKSLKCYDWEGKFLRETSSQFTQLIQQSPFTILAIVGEDSSQSLYFKVLNMSRPSGERIVTWCVKLPDETRLIDDVGSVHPESNTFWKQTILASNPSLTLQTGYRLNGTIDFQEESEPYSRRKIEVLSSTGEIVRTFLFPTNDLSEEEQSMLFYSLNDRVTSLGHLFVTTEKREMREVQRGPWLFQSGYQVVEYDSQGRYKGIRAHLLDPLGSLKSDGLTRLWDVDRGGNLYYLDFQADHLRVMKVRAR